MKAELNFFIKKKIDIGEKGVVKMVQGEKISIMHYVKTDIGIASLTLENSGKVAELKTNPKVQLGFSNKDGDLVDATVTIIDEKETVKAQFDKMLAMKSTHFKKWDDDIVILDMQLA